RRLPAGCARGPGLDRHPARLRGRVPRRAGAAANSPRRATAVPRALGAGDLHARDARVPRAHAHPVERDLVAPAGLDDPRHVDLRLLRIPQQPTAPMTRTVASNPAADGFAMPAEFAPHAGCWLLWPERPDNWREAARPAQLAFTQVAAAIARFEPVTVGV